MRYCGLTVSVPPIISSSSISSLRLPVRERRCLRCLRWLAGCLGADRDAPDPLEEGSVEDREDAAQEPDWRQQPRDNPRPARVTPQLVDDTADLPVQLLLLARIVDDNVGEDELGRERLLC